ncbi:MAG: hypothetical protein AB1635_10780 [Acidobacteriota bacterium]
MDEVLLGVIALAVAVMAAIQVAAIIAGLRMARRVDRIAGQIEHDLKPLVANLTALSSEAARAASLASQQVERFDRAFGDLMERLDATVRVAHQIVTGPARQSLAIVAGVRAAVSAFRGIQAASRRRASGRASRVEEEDSLFIG